jgi:hypothetical protein
MPLGVREVEHLAGQDLLTGLGDQPVVEKGRRPLVADPAGADLGLPEARLGVVPVLAGRGLDIDVLFG